MNKAIAAPSRRLVLLLAVSCGLLAANLYYAQPLLGVIGPAVGLHARAASLIMACTQTGYAVGLLLLAPLGDLVENRRLVVVTVACLVPALGLAALAQSGGVMLAAAGAIGLTAVAVQMLVPLAAHLAPDARRGAVVGNVMSGMLIGILLARPVSSLMTSWLGWRAVFGLSAVAMAVLAAGLRWALPVRRPAGGGRYPALLRSLLALPFTTPVLRHRAVVQAACFACFITFWNAAPLLLARDFHYGQPAIALFALIGAGGALAAPVAGRLGDRGFGRAGTVAGLLMVGAAFGIAWVGAARHVVVVLALAGVVLDLGVQTNLVLGQRAIYALAPAMRSRMNGMFMAIFFIAAAVSSAFTSWIFASAGFAGICVLGAVLPVLALGYFWVRDGR